MVLKLGRNGIGLTGVQAIADLLLHQGRQQQLAAAAADANAAPTTNGSGGCCLRSLDLRANHMGPEAAAPLAAARRARDGGLEA